jgi:hypothetical protein
MQIINQSKNGVELVRGIERLKSLQRGGFSDRLHFVARTFYFRQTVGSSTNILYDDNNELIGRVHNVTGLDFS